MSTPRRGLGRGLGALLGDASTSQSEHAALRDIEIHRIRPNPSQPRKSFEREPLDELQASIAEHGVLVPIMVRQRGDGYELIAGERRWRACAALRLATIPAIVRDGDDRETLEVAMIENLQRENLNPLEEAAGYQALVEEHGLSHGDVALRLGKSRSAVANAVRLLALSEGIKALLAGGRLSAGHARALLAAPPDARPMLAERTVNEGLSVRTLERLAGAASAPPPARPEPKQRALSPNEQEFESRLRRRFGTHVSLVRGERGGRIELRFASEEELIRLGDLLLGDDIPK